MMLQFDCGSILTGFVAQHLQLYTQTTKLVVDSLS